MTERLEWKRRQDAPPLFAVPDVGVDPDVEVQADEPGTDLEVRHDHPLEVVDDDIVEGEIVARYRQPYPSRPVLPVWVVDAAERRTAAEWARGYARFHIGYYGLRTPLYAARIASYTPRGAFRVVRAWAGWVFDFEGRPLRKAAVQSTAFTEYVTLTQIRNERVKLRLIVSGGVAAAAVVSGWIAAATVPYAQPGLLAFAVMVLGVLGYLGRPLDRALIERAVITGADGIAPRLTPSAVVRALGALGISEINKALAKDGEGITFAGDPVRDGPGWRADVDLPFGVTAKDVIAKRDRLASGLRRNIGCVWPEADPDEHAGRLILWVGDKPLRKLAMPPWPLLKDGSADIFRALPFAVDVRGRPVNLTLIFQNLLVGAMPRQGKTFSVRVLLLGASLDPIVQLRVFELKGTGDLSPLRKVAHHYASGIIDPAIEACLRSLEDLDKELERRSELIKMIAARYPNDCRENKVTRALCEDPKWDLKPIVCVIDEAQNLFAHALFGERAAELAERIIKVGPALGIILILATQKPNAKSLPTGVASNVAVRFCLRVADQSTNDMVLGTSQYKNGNRATEFSKADLGIGLLLGEEDDPQIIRTYYIDNPTADQITDRALQLRQEAGTLTGVAAGEIEAIAAAEGLPEHLAAVWPAGETAVWLEVLLPGLAHAHPELYAEWSTTDLGNACRAAGIDRRSLGRGSGRDKSTKRGIDLDALRAVLDSRQKPP
jgi:S-DNA-T family DNA segregation ATPase FtsK/SpoIIIE